MKFLQKISFVIFVSTSLQAQTDTSLPKRQVVIKEKTVISKDLTILNNITYESDLQINKDATVTIDQIVKCLFKLPGAITVHGNSTNYGTLNIKNGYMEIHDRFKNLNTINIHGNVGLRLQASIINKKGGKFNMLGLDNLRDYDTWLGCKNTEYKIKFDPGSTLFLPETQAKIWPIKIKGNAEEPVNIVLHKDIISSYCTDRLYELNYKMPANMRSNMSPEQETKKDNLKKIQSSFKELKNPIIVTQKRTTIFFKTIFDAVNDNFTYIDNSPQNILLNKWKDKIKFIVIDAKNYKDDINSLNETNFEDCSYDQQVSCDN